MYRPAHVHLNLVIPVVSCIRSLPVTRVLLTINITDDEIIELVYRGCPEIPTRITRRDARNEVPSQCAQCCLMVRNTVSTISLG